VRRGVRPWLVLLAAVACAKHSTVRPTPEQAWPATRALAESAAAGGRYTTADSALTAFSSQFPGTREAGESDYWRAVFLIDPRNPQQSGPDAIAALTGYFSAPAPRAHDAEANVLRRTAAVVTALREATAHATSQADSARTEADSVRTQADSARVALASRNRTREEVLRLRDSLDKVLLELSDTAKELDRIKKRLAAPTP
jgi:hypothetical protein